jgi:hypothetical protein
MDSKEWTKIGKQGIPILLALWWLLFPQTMRDYSDTYLGKCLAILIISFYAFCDLTIGLFVCVLIILYYQLQDCLQYETFLSKSTQEYVNHIPKPFHKISSTITGEVKDYLAKDYNSIEDAYPEKYPPIKKVGEALFRKERCHQSRPRYKNQVLNNHVVTHVYPELQFREDVCNPCDKTCHFSIEKKQKIEKDLIPKNTHTSVVEDIQELLGSKKEPVVVLENFVASTFS